jgi:CheY-like chemotaxis protein
VWIKNWLTRLLSWETHEVTTLPDRTSNPWEEETIAYPRSDRKSHSLLIVADEVDLLETLQHQFDRQYRVFAARSGAEAIELLGKHDIHLILADQRMPGMSGVVLMSHAARLQPMAVRIMLTGYAEIQTALELFNEGRIFRFTLKPWDSTELEATLRQAAHQYDIVAERNQLHAEVQSLKLGPKSSTISLSSGDVIGNYRLLEKLGEGGMGAVYKATHLLLNCVFAVKVLKPDSVREPEAVARFLREMKNVGLLDHPKLVRASDAGEIDGVHFLAMEFIDGLNLSDLVLRFGKFGIADSCEIIRQAATGIHNAHEAGLVHRDIKPSNLMLTRSGCTKVLDFGLARLYEGSTTVTELTGSDQLVGTVGYMAPEQAFAKYAVSFRTDMYGLGCTFFKLLTGRTPFSGSSYDTPLRILLAHAQEQATPIRQLRSEIPLELATIIDSLLAKNPAERFGTAAELAAVLERHSAGADLLQLVAGRESRTPAAEN